MICFLNVPFDKIKKRRFLTIYLGGLQSNEYFNWSRRVFSHKTNKQYGDVHGTLVQKVTSLTLESPTWNLTSSHGIDMSSEHHIIISHDHINIKQFTSYICVVWDFISHWAKVGSPMCPLKTITHILNVVHANIFFTPSLSFAFTSYNMHINFLYIYLSTHISGNSSHSSLSLSLLFSLIDTHSILENRRLCHSSHCCSILCLNRWGELIKSIKKSSS